MVGKRSSRFELISLRYAADESIKIYPDPSDYESSPKPLTQHRDWVSPVIVLVTSSAAPFLPIGGGGSKDVAAPSTVPGVYHGSVMCIMFAFSCALSATFLYRKPQAARVFRVSAIVWFSSAFLLLIYSFFCNRFS